VVETLVMDTVEVLVLELSRSGGTFDSRSFHYHVLTHATHMILAKGWWYCVVGNIVAGLAADGAVCLGR